VTVPRIAVPALLAVLLAAGTACGGSDDPGATPSASASPTESSQSTSPDPSESATSSVEAASGPVLDMPLSSVRIPDGWRVMDPLVSTQQDGADDDTASTISLGEIDAFGGNPSPDELARNVLKTNPFPMDPEVQPTVEIGGVEFYHLAGKVQKLDYLEDFGAVVDDMIVNLTFHFSPEVSPAERQEIVDSVVATFRWK
jgi:hypothetical protein